MRRFLKEMVTRVTGSEAWLSGSLVRVYEMAHLYLLTGQWVPPVQYWREAMIMPLLVSFGLSYGVFFTLASPVWCLRTIFYLVVAVLALVGGIAAFVEIFRQLNWYERLFLIVPVMFAPAFWLQSFGDSTNPINLSLEDFILLIILFLAGLFSLVSLAAFGLQWRLLLWLHVIGRWIGVVTDPSSRYMLVARTTAWLLLLAPNGKGGTGLNAQEIITLMEVNRVEREGAEWRGLILSLLALFGIGQLVILRNDLGYFGAAYSLANPANFLVLLLMLLVGCGIALELWLSEFPNRIIGLACIEAQQRLADTTNFAGKIFENYRVITTKKPDTVEHRAGDRWRLIAKHRVTDSEWHYLFEAKRWADPYDEWEEANNQ
jgi:hypothetical protein